MPRRSSFDIALPDIKRHFDGLQQAAFGEMEVGKIFEQHRYEWKLPASWYPGRFIDALTAVPDLLYPIEANFGSRTSKRYGWRVSPDPLDFALALHSGAYLAYYTALSLHGLTDQRPKLVYINVEQTAKSGRDTTLTQEGIDAAFAKTQRTTTDIGELPDGYRIARIKGAHNGRLGVMRTESGRHVTNLERTLIDSAVRPAYCGGVDGVLEAYRRAAPELSVNKLVALLRKLGHVYPYHQAIGFYLSQTGLYSIKQLDMLHAFAKTYDFYLAHDMGPTAYDEQWRIHYPAAWSRAIRENVSMK